MEAQQEILRDLHSIDDVFSLNTGDVILTTKYYFSEMLARVKEPPTKKTCSLGERTYIQLVHRENSQIINSSVMLEDSEVINGKLKPCVVGFLRIGRERRESYYDINDAFLKEAGL